MTTSTSTKRRLSGGTNEGGSITASTSDMSATTTMERVENGLKENDNRMRQIEKRADALLVRFKAKPKIQKR